MVAGLAAVLAFGVGLILGAVGIFLYVRSRKRREGQAGLFVTISLLFPILFCASILYPLYLSSVGQPAGAPTAEDYLRLIIGAVVVGFAPGSGAFVGGVVCYVRARVGMTSA